MASTTRELVKRKTPRLRHAFANPAHERRALALLRAALPGLAVTASTEVLPVVREYERSMAAVLNAAVMPAVSTYIARLEARLDQNFLTIGTGEKTFGSITLNLGDAAQYWAAGLRHVPA